MLTAVLLGALGTASTTRPPATACPPGLAGKATCYSGQNTNGGYYTAWSRSRWPWRRRELTLTKHRPRRTLVNIDVHTGVSSANPAGPWQHDARGATQKIAALVITNLTN